MDAELQNVLTLCLDVNSGDCGNNSNSHSPRTTGLGRQLTPVPFGDHMLYWGYALASTDQERRNADRAIPRFHRRVQVSLKLRKPAVPELQDVAVHYTGLTGWVLVIMKIVD